MQNGHAFVATDATTIGAVQRLSGCSGLEFTRRKSSLSMSHAQMKWATKLKFNLPVVTLLCFSVGLVEILL